VGAGGLRSGVLLGELLSGEMKSYCMPELRYEIITLSVHDVFFNSVSGLNTKLVLFSIFHVFSIPFISTSELFLYSFLLLYVSEQVYFLFLKYGHNSLLNLPYLLSINKKIKKLKIKKSARMLATCSCMHVMPGQANYLVLVEESSFWLTW